jgi:hypothetical protein
VCDGCTAQYGTAKRDAPFELEDQLTVGIADNTTSLEQRDGMTTGKYTQYKHTATTYAKESFAGRFVVPVDPQTEISSTPYNTWSAVAVLKQNLDELGPQLRYGPGTTDGTDPAGYGVAREWTVNLYAMDGTAAYYGDVVQLQPGDVIDFFVEFNGQDHVQTMSISGSVSTSKSMTVVGMPRAYTARFTTSAALVSSCYNVPYHYPTMGTDDFFRLQNVEIVNDNQATVSMGWDSICPADHCGCSHSNSGSTTFNLGP